VDPVKVAGFEIYGVNSTDIGDIKGEAMGGQKGYQRTGFQKKGDYPPIPLLREV
jgi:hypothetical protein